MRSALSQVRGRSLEDFGEQQQRRREVLALYRWTGMERSLARVEMAAIKPDIFFFSLFPLFSDTLFCFRASR